jgi:hypothetical protein
MNPDGCFYSFSVRFPLERIRKGELDRTDWDQLSLSGFMLKCHQGTSAVPGFHEKSGKAASGVCTIYENRARSSVFLLSAMS